MVETWSGESFAVLRPRIMAYLRYAIRDPAERSRVSSDVCAEVYGEMLAHGVNDEADHETVWPIALRVLRRVAREQWRKSREVRIDRAVGHLLGSDDATASRAYRSALWAWEDAAMAHLTTMQRGALELHVMESLKDSDIAAVLGCSVASVRILRATAKKKLRALIQRGVIPEPPRDASTSPLVDR